MRDEQVLKAGGLVPASTTLGKDEAVDTVVARAYRHPALPGRTVVRLTAESTAAGDDLEMSTLGFGAPEDRGAVGKERRRPLGFPGWALVHDPKNARYALDVVKEFKTHARRAKSKPGHAKEGIDAIAERLGKTVPQFLPSFFEEAGRAFLEHGAPSFAATMFNKAREAEAVHALDVDEQHRVDGFLEFALAGAVTTKSLTEYAKDLAEHHEPKVAYGHFRQLCLQRTLGGMPPWAGMAKDLRRLAKAAKLDPAREDGSLIADIIGSPALAKAAGEFWRAYQEPIVTLGQSSAAARKALLDLFPTGTGNDLDDIWLDIVEQSGAIDALVGDVEEAARPTGGRAAWFNKLTAHLARNWRDTTISVRAFTLLRRMAPKLAADGAPITCSGRWNRVDLDLCELALELGVPVALPDHARLDVEAWAKHATEPERGRDPVRSAAHPTIGRLLATAVANEIGDEPFDSQSRGKAGFLAAKRRWLDELLVRAETKALPSLDEVLGVLANKVKAETLAELPDLYVRIAKLDVAPSLARTLQIGLLDELGWPAVEEARAELDPDGKTDVTLHGGLPAFVLVSKTRAIAVGARGRLATFDLVVPPRTEFATIRYIGGQFLVVFVENWRVKGYWSGAPADVFDSDVNRWAVPALAPRAFVHPDGAWQEGKRAIRPGDRVVPERGLYAFDGTTAWTAEWKDGRQKLRELSASGEPGRLSWPRFLETEGEWHVDANLSHILPAPDGLTTSPLGLKDGFVGVRVRYQGAQQNAKTANDLTTIDGRTWSGPSHSVCDLVVLPSGEQRPLMEDTARRGAATVSLLDERATVRGLKITGGDRRYWRGSAFAYPGTAWHHLTPRDVAGSKRLRCVTDADARALLDAVPPGANLEELVPVEVVRVKLPEVTHPGLQRGIAGVVALAKQLDVWRAKIADERAPGKAIARHATIAISDDAIKAALGGWVEHRYANSGSAAEQIARIGEWFGSDDRSDRDGQGPLAQVDWFALPLVPGALAFLAGAIGAPPASRKVLVELARVFAERLPDPAKLRVWVGKYNGQASDPFAQTQFALFWRGGNAYAIAKQGYWGGRLHVLEYAPSGEWKPLPNLDVLRYTHGGRALAPDQLAAIEGAVATGTTSWSADAAAALASATGLTTPEAAYLWAGCPNMNNRGANFLDKQLREQLGLKAQQAAVARDSLKAVPQERLLSALNTAGHDIASVLAGNVQGLAAAWIRLVGKRVAIPEGLIADADRELAAPMEPPQALAMIANANEAPQLNVDGEWGVDKEGEPIRVSGPKSLAAQLAAADAPVAFTQQTLNTVASYVPFLFAQLPVGDPLRAQAASAYERMLERLKNPTLAFSLGQISFDAQNRAGADALLASFGGELVSGTSAGRQVRVVPGAVLVRFTWSYGTPPVEYVRVAVHVRPATLDAKTAVQLGKLASMVHASGYSPWRTLEIVRGDDFAAIARRIRETPVRDGGWEQNPLASAATVVDKVAAGLGVSPEAAALYLQYLVLLWPTPKNLARWNGWKPKQLEAAQRELLAKELILEAKRERAQRAHFLPGGWEAHKSPHPPMESWKASLYGARNAQGDVVPHLVRFAALAPFHVLFERAWKRIEAGDVPKYDEVKR